MTQNTEQNRWMPLTAGILTIIAGGTKLLAFLGLLIALFFVPARSYSSWDGSMHMMYAPNVMIGIMIPLLILGVLALIGGIFMLRRRLWGMALTGAIAALIPNTLLGIAAVILVALSKDQFDQHESM